MRPSCARCAGATVAPCRRVHGRRLRHGDQNGKPVVVYFYPADEMPGCTKQENLEIMHYFGSLKKQGKETNASSDKE
ncbi:unnamed protein product [Urochloa humidicola]